MTEDREEIVSVKQQVTGSPAEVTMVTEAAEVEIATSPATNPHNPTHTLTCHCPSCCKKAKLARGEQLNHKTHKAPPPRPTPPLSTHERAVVAATQRWANDAAAHYDWEHAPLEAAAERLASLRREIETGARALQQRYDTSKQVTVSCHVCHKPIPNGKWMMQKTVRNADTGLQATLFLCGQLCIARFQQNPSNYPPPGMGPTGLPTPEPPEFTKADKHKGAN